MQRPDPQAFRQCLQTLAHPSLRSGEKSREGARHLAPRLLDRASLGLRQRGIAAEQRSVSRKELVFLKHKRHAARYLRNDLCRWGMGEVKKAAEQREWGDVPLRGSPSFGGVSNKSVGHPLSYRASETSGPSHCNSLSKTRTRCTSTSFPRSATASGVRAT